MLGSLMWEDAFRMPMRLSLLGNLRVTEIIPASSLSLGPSARRWRSPWGRIYRFGGG